jgi:hypothetical protein
MSPRKPSSGWNRLRLLLGLVLALPLAAARAAPGGDEYYLNLPAVFKPPPGIFGRITHNGGPAAGISVELRFYNGSSYSSAGFASTDANGVYRFASAPSLGPGQSYYVRYLNNGLGDSYLWNWFTRDLNAYSEGATVNIGDFDLANFSHTAPASGAYVPLPQGFSWAFRPATPADSFDFNLFDPDDGNPWFWTNPPLGHVNNYTLFSLPGGFGTNTWYGWFPGVYSPDGGYGVPYYFRWVAFSSAGQAVSGGAAPLAGTPLGELLIARREAGGK